MIKFLCRPAFVILMGLGACAPVPPSNDVGSLSSFNLWQEQQVTQSALRLAFVEAELVSRGETKLGNAFIGQRTASAFGQSIYTRSLSSSAPASNQGSVDLRNCSDFATSYAAQKFFLDAGGPVEDPNRLDADGDGLACEWGTQVRQISRTARTPPPPRVRQTFTSRCYTGPRGGRYTLTSSGARDYNGC